MEKIKIRNLEQLIELKNNGLEIHYEYGLNEGVVRRVEKIDNYHLVVIKLMSQFGLVNLCEFKFYKKPKEVYLTAFYYNKES